MRQEPRLYAMQYTISSISHRSSNKQVAFAFGIKKPAWSLSHKASRLWSVPATAMSAGHARLAKPPPDAHGPPLPWQLGGHESQEISFSGHSSDTCAPSASARSKDSGDRRQVCGQEFRFATFMRVK